MERLTDRIHYHTENHVAYLTIDYPACANALDEPMEKDLLAYLQLAGFDSNIRAVVIQAEGRLFSGGGNLNELCDLTEHIEEKSALIDECLTFPGTLSCTIRKIGKPVIGAIQGALAGAAANIMLACDFRIVSEDMFMVEAFVNIGLCTDGGGTYLLGRMLGAARATELVMLGQRISARDALRLGLVNKIVSRDALHNETKKFAERLAKGPGKVYQYLKQLINQTMFFDMETVLATEVEYQRICLRSSDAREGIHAFLEKRPPTYQGQ